MTTKVAKKLLSKYFAELGRKSYEIRLKKFGAEYMINQAKLMRRTKKLKNNKNYGKITN